VPVVAPLSAAMTEQPAVALDILYPSGFYSYQTPVMLDYAAAINGVAPPVKAGAPFTYLDLGCGDGFTIVLLAAIYPECRFIGVDFNPGHIAVGTALARAGGIENVRFVEGAFEDWRDFDLPECDYIAMHGVYAWISEAARSAVLELVAARLAPDGLLYVSYNANPGWASVAPLRQFFLDYTRGMTGDPVANVAATLRHLKELRDKGAGYFVQNPAAGGVLDEMAGKDIRYVAHEIYSPHWSPLPFSTVARQMRERGLAFAGSADLARNYPRPSVKATFLPLLLKSRDRERAELYRDFLNNAFFRRDVFVKAPEDAPRRPVTGLLEPFAFGSKVPFADLARAIKLPDGELPLVEEPFEGLRRVLADQAQSIADLRARPQFATRNVEELGQALELLVLGNQITPFKAPSLPGTLPADWTVPLPLNRHLLAEPVGSEPYLLVISPFVGSAVPVPRGEAVVLLAVAEAGREGALEWSWDYVAARQAWLSVKGIPATKRDGHRAAFAQTLDALAPRLAKLVEFGVIAPR
jgi:SAM-dependent methyltransferase